GRCPGPRTGGCPGPSPGQAFAGTCAASPRRARRRGRRGRGRRTGVGTRLAVRVEEVAEEVRIRTHQQPRVALLQASIVSLHRAIEGEEVLVLVERIRKDAVALGIAFSARLLALRGRFGHDDGGVAVGLGLDLLGALQALRSELLRLALALGLHALVDRLAV